MFDADELDDLRELQNDQLNGLCRIFRITLGNDTVNPVTLQIEGDDEEDIAGSLELPLPMKIEATTRNYERSHTVGEARLTTRTHNLRIPIEGTENVRINDWLEIIEAHDPAYNGLKMVIIDTPTTSTPTIRFLIAEDIINDNPLVP